MHPEKLEVRVSEVRNVGKTVVAQPSISVALKAE